MNEKRKRNGTSKRAAQVEFECVCVRVCCQPLLIAAEKARLITQEWDRKRLSFYTYKTNCVFLNFKLFELHASLATKREKLQYKAR